MASYTKTMWHHVRRSPYQALAAVLIMMVTFLTISVFTLLIVGSDKIINFFESKPQVTAFFKDEAKSSDIDAIKNQLSKSVKVSSVKYVSKDQALQIYREQNKNDPLLLELVTADILPASLEISTRQIEDLGPIADDLKNNPAVQEVVYQKDVIATLTSWTNALRKIGIAIIAILAFVSILIMVTIISIKVSQKREEIEIMRLIGATNWYISLPFVYEAVFYSAVGAVIGWGISSLGIWYLSPYLASFLKGIPMPVNIIFLLELLGAELLIAAFLGIFSSLIAVNRFLNR